MNKRYKKIKNIYLLYINIEVYLYILVHNYRHEIQVDMLPYSYNIYVNIVLLLFYY